MLVSRVNTIRVLNCFYQLRLCILTSQKPVFLRSILFSLRRLLFFFSFLLWHPVWIS